MTKSTIICSFILLVFLCGNAFSGGISEVELIDGSVISGEIVSFRDGIYKLKSGILGTIEINESKISLIRLKSCGKTTGDPVSPSNTSINNELQSLQKSLMYNQEIMKLILSLQNDPDIQELLQDSVIMNAVNSGDINALISNPKFMKIMEKTTIQQIQNEVTK